jgi:hypothetical protein
MNIAAAVVVVVVVVVVVLVIVVVVVVVVVVALLYKTYSLFPSVIKHSGQEDVCVHDGARPRILHLGTVRSKPSASSSY